MLGGCHDANGWWMVDGGWMVTDVCFGTYRYTCTGIVFHAICGINNIAIAVPVHQYTLWTRVVHVDYVYCNSMALLAIIVFVLLLLVFVCAVFEYILDVGFASFGIPVLRSDLLLQVSQAVVPPHMRAPQATSEQASLAVSEL